MKKVAILLNPSSGRGKSLKRKTRIERILKANKIEYDLFISESENHLKQLVANTAYHYSTIVGVGGDTSLNIMVAEMLNLNLPVSKLPALGMIGTGSANDIVRGLGIHKIKDACAAIKNGSITKMDVGRLQINDNPESKFFMGSVSAGLGTTVNRYVEYFHQNHKIISKVKPFYQFLPGVYGIYNSFLRNLLPLQTKIEYLNERNGEIIAKKVNFSLLVFLNTPYYANGLKLGKDNGSFDGMLDCCVVDTQSFWRTFAIGLRIQRGAHARCRKVEWIYAPSFKVSSEVPMDILADGDIYSSVNKFEVSVIKGGLKVLLPTY